MKKLKLLQSMTLAVAVAAAVGYARIATADVLRGLGVTVGGPRFLSREAGAVVNLKSTAITNNDSTPVVLNTCVVEKGAMRESQGFANISNGDSIASTYRLFRIRSNERLSQLLLWGPAIATAIGSIGLYDTTANGGAVVSAAFYANAQALTGALSAFDVTFQAAALGGSIANAEKRVWEALGLAVDPGKEYDVVLTLTAAAGAGGVYLARAQIVAQV